MNNICQIKPKGVQANTIKKKKLGLNLRTKTLLERMTLARHSFFLFISMAARIKFQICEALTAKPYNNTSYDDYERKNERTNERTTTITNNTNTGHNKDDEKVYKTDLA